MPNQPKPNPQQQPNVDRNRPHDQSGTPRHPSPGTERDPYRHPGSEPDVKPDVIADEDRPSKGGYQPGQRNPGNPADRSGGEGKK